MKEYFKVKKREGKLGRLLPLTIFAVLLVVSFIAFVVYKTMANRKDKAEAKTRAQNIANSNAEDKRMAEERKNNT